MRRGILRTDRYPRNSDRSSPSLKQFIAGMASLWMAGRIWPPDPPAPIVAMSQGPLPSGPQQQLSLHPQVNLGRAVFAISTAPFAYQFVSSLLELLFPSGHPVVVSAPMRYSSAPSARPPLLKPPLISSAPATVSQSRQTDFGALLEAALVKRTMSQKSTSALWTPQPDEIRVELLQCHSRFYFRLFDGFCYEDWDHPIRFFLVLLIRRVCFYCDIPESLSLDWVYYLSNPHRIDFGLVANFNIRFRL